MIKIKVSMYFPCFLQAAGHVFSWFLLSKVVSCTGSTLAREGLVEWLWFGCRSSYRPAALCEGFQEVLLRNYIGGFSLLCQLWSIEASKVGPPIGRKSAFLMSSEVVFPSFPGFPSL